MGCVWVFGMPTWLTFLLISLQLPCPKFEGFSRLRLKEKGSFCPVFCAPFAHHFLALRLIRFIRVIIGSSYLESGHFTTLSRHFEANPDIFCPRFLSDIIRTFFWVFGHVVPNCNFKREAFNLPYYNSMKNAFLGLLQ